MSEKKNSQVKHSIIFIIQMFYDNINYLLTNYNIARLFVKNKNENHILFCSSLNNMTGGWMIAVDQRELMAKRFEKFEIINHWQKAQLTNAKLLYVTSPIPFAFIPLFISWVSLTLLYSSLTPLSLSPSRQ